MVFVTLNIFANEQNRGKQRCCSVNFTLGPSNICIYIESIRFWFIIVTNLGWGQGAGGGWQAFCHLLWGPCPWASLREETGDNYGAGTKLLLLSPVTHCFKSEEKKSDKDGHRALLCLSPLRDFQVLMNLSAQHWSCGDYCWSLALINQHVPLIALAVTELTNRIQAESERYTADGHMTNGFIAPLWRFES